MCQLAKVSMAFPNSENNMSGEKHQDLLHDSYYHVMMMTGFFIVEVV